MPLVYSPAEIEAAIASGKSPGPFNSTTPAKCTGVFVQNVSPFNIVLSSSLG